MNPQIQERQADFFFKHTSQKEKLYEWLKQKKWVRTSEILIWGVENYCNSADRLARKLASEGKIKRMDKGLKNFRFNTKEDIWEII